MSKLRAHHSKTPSPTGPWWQGTGNIWILGLPLSQSWLELGAILSALWEYRVTLCVEIGVDQGGLAALLAVRTRTVPGFRYRGVELWPHKVDQRAKDLLAAMPDAHILYADCFAPEAMAWVTELVQASPGPALVLCDGGDKPREFREFGALLRRGDLLAVHDLTIEITEADLAARPADLVRLQPAYLQDTRLALFRRR